MTMTPDRSVTPICLSVLLLALLGGCASPEKKEPVQPERLKPAVSKLAGDPAWVDLGILASRRGYSQAGKTEEGRIRLRKGGREVQIDPRSRVAYFDGELVMMRVRPREDAGRLFVTSSIDREFAALETSRVVKPKQPAPKPIPSGKLAGAHFVLDAGHGGKDSGAARGRLREKDVVLDITLQVGRMLEQQGARITYTRKTDRFISLDRRAEISNGLNPTAFISVHVNAAERTSAKGIEIWLPGVRMTGQRRDKLMQSRKLGADILRRLEPVSPGKDRGLKKSPGFRVLKYNDHPAVLLELGFLSNSEERARLANANYRRRLAEAVVAGLRDYVARG